MVERGRLRGRIVVGTLLAFGVAACDEGAPSTTMVADSSGITVVTNLPGSIEQAEEWTVASEPTVDIGSGDLPDVPLYRVTAVSPLETGGVAVGTAVPPRVLLFDSEGSVRATLGREGQGPGEFSDVGSIVVLAPDSIAVWDPDRRRVSVFGEDGSLRREVDLTAIAPMSARAAENAREASGFIHMLPSAAGSVILFAEAVLGPTEEGVIARHEMPALRVGTDGDLLAELGSFPDSRPARASPAHSARGPTRRARTVTSSSERRRRPSIGATESTERSRGSRVGPTPTGPSVDPSWTDGWSCWRRRSHR